jgi:hypothetical protein
MIKDIALALDFYGEYGMGKQSDRYKLLLAIRDGNLFGLSPRELSEAMRLGYVTEEVGILRLTDDGFRYLDYMEKRQTIQSEAQTVREA